MPYKNVPWPQDQPVPASFSKALRSGWEFEGFEASEDDAHRNETGVVFMSKKIGEVKLQLDVPYTAVSKYSAPRKSWAVIEVEPPAEPKQLFDVVYHPPKKQIIRVRAVNEDKAVDAADEVIVYEKKLVVRRPDKTKRVIYENIPGKGLVSTTGGRKRATR